jgi:hypothetical protein
LPVSKAVPVNRVFILGAGFSRAFGFTTSDKIVKGVMEFIDENRPAPWYSLNYERVIEWLSRNHPNWRNEPPDLKTFIKDFFSDGDGSTSETYKIDPLALHEQKFSWDRGNFADIASKSLPENSYYEYYLLSFEALMCTYLFSGLMGKDVDKKWAKEIFTQITNNDVILTFNWDVIAEFLLVKVNKPFTRYEWDSNQVKLVKLHGSIDLIGVPNEQMKRDFAEKSNRFECLTPYIWRARTSKYELARTKPWPLGREILPWERYNKSGIFIMPPFYTMGYGYEMIQFNWRKAKTALERAKEIIIIGYSFSDDDFAFHNLINNVKQSWSSEVKVHVWNPNQRVGEKAKKLFGSNHVVFHQSNASDVIL